MDTTAEFTKKEKEAWDLILKAHVAIKLLGEGSHSGGKLLYNHDELAQAVHVLQSFVKQHVLHRIMPDEFSNWWGK